MILCRFLWARAQAHVDLCSQLSGPLAWCGLLAHDFRLVHSDFFSMLFWATMAADFGVVVTTTTQLHSSGSGDPLRLARAPPLHLGQVKICRYNRGHLAICCCWRLAIRDWPIWVPFN